MLDLAVRLGWTKRRSLPAVLVGALVTAVAWAWLSDRYFAGTARSLLGVDVVALMVAAVAGVVAAPSWRGRAAAFLAVVALAVASLAVAYVGYNMANPTHG